MKLPQRVAIVHFHLRPGGVTRVIRHAWSALSHLGVRTVLLAGPSDSADVPPGAITCNVAGLGYADTETPVSPEALANALTESAMGALGEPPELWHIHNHALGKNPALPLALQILAARGCRLLLQIHDFPEDGRPNNYRRLLDTLGEGKPSALGRRLYPQGRHIHYAVLNTRDYAFFLAAGMPPERLHLLPNPVGLEGEEPAEPSPPKGAPLFLYPTRAIRRKNLGELLLWATISRGRARFATTLAPTSAEDRAPYERWKALARELELPVEFELGLSRECSYQRLLEQASAVVTTSVGEGFGLAFLEPWLLRRPLFGRDLPELTSALKEEGLDFSALYSALWCPLEWVGADEFRERLRTQWGSLLAAYGRKPKSNDVERAFAAACHDGRVDFGRLDEDLQERIIRRLKQQKSDADELQPPQLVVTRPSRKVMDHNREVVHHVFGLQTYAWRLREIYAQLLDAEPGPAEPINANKLLDLFLSPDRFYLLRT